MSASTSSSPESLNTAKKRKAAEDERPPTKQSRKGRHPTSEKAKPTPPGTKAHAEKDGKAAEEGANLDDSGKKKAHFGSSSGTGPRPQRPKTNSNRHKLPPRRPFPTVPTSSNATGPRSARAEGNNQFCITRKAPFAQYLRRCKEAVVQYGYRTLELSAMTAAIPTLLILTESIPETLPFARDEIKIEYRTGTVKCVDELLPGEDESEDDGPDTIQSDLVERNAASLSVVIQIGDGKKQPSGHEKKSNHKPHGAKKAVTAEDAMSTDDDE